MPGGTQTLPVLEFDRPCLRRCPSFHFDPCETFAGTRDLRAIPSVIPRTMTFGCSDAPKSTGTKATTNLVTDTGLRIILVTTLEILTLAELQAVQVTARPPTVPIGSPDRRRSTCLRQQTRRADRHT